MSGFVRANLTGRATVVPPHRGISPSLPSSISSSSSSAASLSQIPISHNNDKLSFVGIPGVRPWLNGLSVTGSGSIDVDIACGRGGFFLHSLICYSEDDSIDNHSFIHFLKLFIAQGRDQQHQIIVVSTQTRDQCVAAFLPYNLTQSLSSSSSITSAASSSSSTLSSRSSASEFAYNDKQHHGREDKRSQPKVNQEGISIPPRNTRPSTSSSRGVSLSYEYDLCKTIACDDYQHILVEWDHDHRQDHRLVYRDTYVKIASLLSQQYPQQMSSPHQNITRLVIESLGDIQWNYESSTEAYDPSFIAAVYHYCHDVFIIDTLPLSSAYRDNYDALLTIHHLHHEHTFNPHHIEHRQYLIQCERQLKIDKISLPPEHQQHDEQNNHSTITTSTRGGDDDDDIETLPSTLPISNKARGIIQVDDGGSTSFHRSSETPSQSRARTIKRHSHPTMGCAANLIDF